MPGFKDILKKTKEAAAKGLKYMAEAAEFQKMVSDFDELVGSIIVDILQNYGYRSMSMKESGDYFQVRLTTDDIEPLKHIIDRDVMRHFSYKDRQKIKNVMVDEIIVNILYRSKRRQQATLATLVEAAMGAGKLQEDVQITAKLKYFVEKEGGLIFKGIKRVDRTVDLGSFSFPSKKYIDYENKQVLLDELRQYLEEKLKAIGLIPPQKQ